MKRYVYVEEFEYEYDLYDIHDCIEYSRDIIIRHIINGGIKIDEIWGAVHKLRHSNIKLAAALATVFTVGYYISDNYGDTGFMLPVYNECAPKYKEVYKALAKNKPLYITEYYYNEDEEGCIETTKTYISRFLMM